MGNAPSLPGLGGGRTHGMRYSDDADSSWKGRRPEGIPVENMEVQLTERIEESTGRGSGIEVLEPSVSHITSSVRSGVIILGIIFLFS